MVRLFALAMVLLCSSCDDPAVTDVLLEDAAPQVDAAVPCGDLGERCCCDVYQCLGDRLCLVTDDAGYACQ